jgi:pSer/pThr/pTyr-binding forkhead associated (FHA) protein
MTPSFLMLLIRVLLALILYAFLGFVLIALWRDNRAADEVDVQIPNACLTPLEGLPDMEVIRLQHINLIGRAADNTIILQEDTVSAHHARLSYQGQQWWLDDLGSKNGTFVNELRMVEPLIITYGDVLSFGKVVLRVDLCPVEEPTPTIT